MKLIHYGIEVVAEQCWRLHSPNPGLTAQDVVEMQILALGAARDESAFIEGINKCFEYASPANKQNTGPAQRFGHMIRCGYPAMLNWQSYKIHETERQFDNSIQFCVHLALRPGKEE